MLSVFDQSSEFKVPKRATPYRKDFEEQKNSERAREILKTTHILNTDINPKYFLKKSVRPRTSSLGFLSGSKRFNYSKKKEVNPGPADYHDWEGTIMQKYLKVGIMKDMMSVENMYMQRKKKNRNSFKLNNFSIGDGRLDSYFRKKKWKVNRSKRNKNGGSLNIVRNSCPTLFETPPMMVPSVDFGDGKPGSKNIFS